MLAETWPKEFARALLQWGRGGIAPEIDYLRVITPKDAIASMGPGQDRLGNGVQAGCGKAERVASMGPGLSPWKYLGCSI
jgi:hypothetical protein